MRIVITPQDLRLGSRAVAIWRHPVSVEKTIRVLKQFNGIVEQASEEELADAAALGDTTGMFAFPHTGVALAAMIKLLKKGKIDPKERVVVISTAHGLKFADFKVRYHARQLDIPSRHAIQPIELPPKLEAGKGSARPSPGCQPRPLFDLAARCGLRFRRHSLRLVSNARADVVMQ